MYIIMLQTLNDCKAWIGQLYEVINCAGEYIPTKKKKKKHFLNQHLLIKVIITKSILMGLGCKNLILIQ